MGRYSSVQAYGDNNANARTVSYEQATGSAEVKRGNVKPEKVVNPYGSTAGAGSGEFHVYRHARAREMERITNLDKEQEEARKDEEFQQAVQQYKQEEDQRTEKRRKKRKRQKEAKLRKKNLAQAGIISTNEQANSRVGGQEDDEEEFTYTPVYDKDGKEKEKPSDHAKESAPPKPEFPNDGSFLEMMQKKLEAEKAATNVEAEKAATNVEAEKAAANVEAEKAATEAEKATNNVEAEKDGEGEPPAKRQAK